MRWTSPDPIIPGIGEGGDPNAVGCLGASNYSPLTVDYHENQLLVQLNLENRLRLQEPTFRLPPVPTNSIAFDRYAYSLNNPIRYNDPSGHCPFCLTIPFLGVPGIGWVVVGIAGVATVVYIAAGGPEAVANGLEQAGQAVSNGVNALFSRKADLGFIDRLLDKYGVKDRAVRERIHRQISKQHYTDKEIEDIVAGEAELINKPDKKEGNK